MTLIDAKQIIVETERLVARYTGKSINKRGAAMLTSSSLSRNYNPALRGYHAVYRENAINHCPGCGRTHWLIGRLLAECGFCGTALPLSESYARGSPAPSIRHGSKVLQSSKLLHRAA